MNWTCEQTELLLTDYLDGLLQPEQQHAFNLHVNACERCTPLVASVTHIRLTRTAPSISATSASFTKFNPNFVRTISFPRRPKARSRNRRRKKILAGPTAPRPQLHGSRTEQTM